MWIILGFVLAATIGVVGVLAAGHRGAAHLDDHPWLLRDAANLHVTILAGLAGFAFTGVVLVVTFVRDRTAAANTALDVVIVMFLVAYLWWVGGAFLISYIPHRDTAGDLVPRVHFSLATAMEYRTVFLSWFALLPLLEANGLGHLAWALYFLLPASLLCGSVLVAMAYDGLGIMKFWEIYLSAGVAIALSSVYTGVVAFAAPWARTPYSALYVTLLIFCINGLGFGFAALTPLSPRYASVKRLFEHHGRAIVLADAQLTMASLTFLWLAVVGVI